MSLVERRPLASALVATGLLTVGLPLDAAPQNRDVSQLRQLIRYDNKRCGLSRDQRRGLAERLEHVVLTSLEDPERAAFELTALQLRAAGHEVGVRRPVENPERLLEIDGATVTVPSLRCLDALETDAIGTLFDASAPGHDALFALFFDAWSLQVRAPVLFWLAERNARRMEHFLDRRPATEDGDEAHALQLMVWGDAMRRSGLFRWVVTSRGLFERAVERDPALVAARYLAATMNEKLGRYRRAARHFAELQKSDAEDAETALHLAVDLARTGAHERALEVFAEITGPPPALPAPAWVRVVAIEEQARVLTELDRPAAARSLLEEALVVHPEERQLWLALAALDITDSELQNRVHDALLAPQPTTGPSPRLRYDMPRDEILRDVEHRYQELIRTARAALRGAAR